MEDETSYWAHSYCPRGTWPGAMRSSPGQVIDGACVALKFARGSSGGLRREPESWRCHCHSIASIIRLVPLALAIRCRAIRLIRRSRRARIQFFALDLTQTVLTLFWQLSREISRLNAIIICASR